MRQPAKEQGRGAAWPLILQTGHLSPGPEGGGRGSRRQESDSRGHVRWPHSAQRGCPGIEHSRVEGQPGALRTTATQNLICARVEFHPAGCRRLKAAQVRASAPRQPWRRDAPEHQVFQTHLRAIFAFAALIAVLVDRVDVWLEPPDFRVGIQPAAAAGNERLLHMPDRTDHVAPFRLGKPRMAFALEQADVRVVADNDVKVAVGADLLEKPHMPAVEPVVAAGDDHLLAVGCRRHRRRRGKPSIREAGTTRYSGHAAGNSRRAARWPCLSSSTHTWGRKPSASGRLLGSEFALSKNDA